MNSPRLLLALALLAPSALAAEPLPSIDTAVKTSSMAPLDAAVVIGVEDYWKLPRVPYALADAEAFYTWAVYTRGVPIQRIERLDNNPSAADIVAAVKRAGAATAAGGTIWLYFSGHGMAARDGRRMVLGGSASGADREALEQGGAVLDDLELAATAHGARVVAIIDACYTGEAVRLGDRTAVPPYSLPHRDVVEWLAAGADETSGPLEAAGHGAFTYFAIGALRGWADGQLAAADGKVLGDEAQLYVEAGLKAARVTGQRPEMHGDGWTNLVLSTGARDAGPVLTAIGGGAVAAPVVLPKTGDAVVDVGSGFQSQLAAAKQAAAAEAEKQFLATEAARQRTAKLDAAEATLRAQATADWTSARSLVDGGGAGAKAAADAFIAAYGSAKVRLDSEERTVVIAEVVTAQKVSASAAAQVKAAANPRVAALALASPTAGAGSDFASPTLGTMKWIPAGTFTMGSTRETDETPHPVTLTKGYWLMEHEVTQGEYQAVMGKNPAGFTACAGDCPIGRVSWYDAVAFAKAASSRDGVTYRLPTEAEWEWAARGGQSLTYAGSEEVGAVAWTKENSGSTTHAVCTKHRNGYGLCDMSGNVFEWASDWYATYPGAVTNPEGPVSGSHRVYRGGGWGADAEYAAVSFRYDDSPGAANNNVGVRLSRSSP